MASREAAKLRCGSSIGSSSSSTSPALSSIAVTSQAEIVPSVAALHRNRLTASTWDRHIISKQQQQQQQQQQRTVSKQRISRLWMWSSLNLRKLSLLCQVEVDTLVGADLSIHDSQYSAGIAYIPAQDLPVLKHESNTAADSESECL